MVRRYHLVGALFAGLASVSLAWAGEWPTWKTTEPNDPLGCGQTDLLHSNLSIRFLGNNPNDAEIGDRRILYWTLKDLDGEIIGSFDVLSTVLGRTTDLGDVVHAEGLLTLDTGDIFIDGIVPLGDATDTSRSGPDDELIELRISGGTGEFFNSTGRVLISVPNEADEHLRNRPITLQVDC